MLWGVLAVSLSGILFASSTRLAVDGPRAFDRHLLSVLLGVVSSMVYTFSSPILLHFESQVKRTRELKPMKNVGSFLKILFCDTLYSGEYLGSRSTPSYARVIFDDMYLSDVAFPVGLFT